MADYYIFGKGYVVDENVTASNEDKETTVVKEEPKEEEKFDLGVNFNYFTSDKAVVDTGESKEAKKKRKVKISSEPAGSNSQDLANPIPGADVATVNYANSYNETNAMLRTAIYQTDELSSEIKSDIDDIRSSKTIKNKYTYLTNLTASASALIGTKINAIKEMNSTITQSHNLELNRMKALKLDKSDENDEMKMMDIYSAFVNTPIGTYSPQAPSIQDLTLGVNSSNSPVNAVEMVNPSSQQSNLTPEQIRMRMESNPNIEVVVRYNQSTGQRCFDVIDKTNMTSVTGYPRPDAFLLEDTTIDVHAGIARNRNINTVWPLIVDGAMSTINEY